MSASAPLVMAERLMLSHLVQDARRPFIPPAAMAVLAFLCCAGLAFVAYGLYAWLEPARGASVAAAIAGGSLLSVVLMAALCYGGYRYYRSYRVRVIQNRAGAMFKNIVSEVNRECAGPIRENPRMALILALAAGMLAGRRL